MQRFLQDVDTFRMDKTELSNCKCGYEILTLKRSLDILEKRLATIEERLSKIYNCDA